MVKSMLVKAWNKLPIELKNTEKLLNFKLWLNAFLFDFKEYCMLILAICSDTVSEALLLLKAKML